MTPNEYFDDIFCINLDRRPDRWNTINDRFKREGLHVTRWTATDALEREIKVDYHLLRTEKPGSGIKNAGGYAILLSYLKLFYHIRNQGYEKVLIFEDDAIFIEDFLDHFRANIRDIPSNWEMWALGCSQYGTHELDFTPDHNFFSPTPPNNTYGLFAFAIKKCYIDTVIKILEKRMSYADTEIFTHTYDGESRIYISCPPICSHSDGYSDNINKIKTSINVLQDCPGNTSIVQPNYH